ncbi:MAG: hypothetical protein V2A58_03265 [Planctomycetota bacterium]
MKTTGLFVMAVAVLAVAGGRLYADDYGVRYFTTPQTTVTYSTDIRETRAVQYPNGMTTPPRNVAADYNPHLTGINPNPHLTGINPNPHLTGIYGDPHLGVRMSPAPVFYPPYPVYYGSYGRLGGRHGRGRVATPVAVVLYRSYPLPATCVPVTSSNVTFSIRIGW